MTFRVLPVILSCEADLGLTRKFVVGFGNVRDGLERPVVLIDQSGSPRLSAEYLALLSSLDPSAVYVHPREPDMSTYDSVQVAANIALEFALQHAQENDYILFLEDDIAFSSHFADKAVNTYLGPETGFLTFYMPGTGYGSHIIDPARFYGTQCLLFTRKAVEEIVRDRAAMMADFLPGYDIRWSRFLARRGYVLYCPDRSYVQHLPGISRLHRHESHASSCFCP